MEKNLILKGEINKKLNGEFHLKVSNNQLRGYFLNVKSRTEIPVVGSFNKDILRIEEYAVEDQLTGIFIGRFEDGIYIGNWHSPDNSSIVPFEFTNRKKSNSGFVKKENIKIDTLEFAKKMHVYYDGWRSKAIKTDLFCSLAECEKVYNNLDYYEGRPDMCDTSLPDSTENFIFGYLNSDQYLDAAANVNIISCMGGNARRFESVILLFVSTENGLYEVVEITEYKLGNASGVKHIDSGQIVFVDFEYDDMDANCCPSIETRRKFDFNDNRLSLAN